MDEYFIFHRKIFHAGNTIWADSWFLSQIVFLNPIQGWYSSPYGGGIIDNSNLSL